MITALCVLLSAVMAVSPPTNGELVARMMLTEIVQDGEMNRSQDLDDPGQCKRFQVNTFAEVSGPFILSGYPETVLFMPPDHAPKADTGRTVGTAWNMTDAETGNAYDEVARFDYDTTKTEKENLQDALLFLTNIRAGDQLQMLGRYTSGGRGTHTLMFTRPYDPRSDYLYWSDSNFATRRIDGIRYGIVRPFQAWKVSECAGWLASDWGNGATLYRLRDDIVKRDGH